MNCSRALPSDRFRRSDITIQSRSTVPLNEGVMNNGQRSNMSLLSNPSSYIAETQHSSPFTYRGKDVLENCPFPSFRSTSNLIKLTGSKKLPTKKETVIKTMKNYLNIHKRVHFSVLCDTAEAFFKSYSDCRKFRFFVDNPQHFCVEDYNFITSNTGSLGQNVLDIKMPNFVIENASTVSECQQKKPKKRQILKILISILKKRGKMHFKNLCTANKSLKIYFQPFTSDKIFQYFNDKPSCFVITCGGHVSLCGKVKKSNNFSTLSCNNSLVSNPNVSVQKSSSSKIKAKSIFSILEKPTNSPTSQRLRNVYKSNGRNSTLCVQRNSGVGRSRCNSNAASSDQTTPVADTRYVDTFSQNYVKYVIYIFKARLNLKKRSHYLKLCAHLEKYNKIVREFFASQSFREKFLFFEKYPRDFHITADKYVCLPKYANDISSTAKSTSVSLNHVQEKEVIGILISALKVCPRIHYEKLCKYSEKVETFFSFYSASKKFKFYKSFPKYFYLVSDGYVRLSTSVDYHLSLENIGVSTITTKNPVACAKNINSVENTTKDENYSSVKPLQERLFLMSDHEIDASSNHLMLDVNDTENYTKSKIINGEIAYPIRSKSAVNNSISSAFNVDTFTPFKEHNRSSCRSDCAGSQINNTTILKNTNSGGRHTTFRDEKRHNHNCRTYSAAKSHPVDNKENVAVELDHWSSQQRIYEPSEGKLSGSITSTDQLIYKSKINCGCFMGRQTGEVDSTYFVPEVMERMINRLKIDKCVHYLKLYEVCEQCNWTVKNFFCTFSEAEKLLFNVASPVVDERK